MSKRRDAEREAASLRNRWADLRDYLADEVEDAAEDDFPDNDEFDRAEVRARAETLRKVIAYMDDAATGTPRDSELIAELPDPRILDEYEAVLPGARERLLTMRRNGSSWEEIGKSLRWYTGDAWQRVYNSDALR